MKWLRNTKAFTLIEILIVICILAILGAVVAPTLMSTTKDKPAVTEQSKPQKTVGDY